MGSKKRGMERQTDRQIFFFLSASLFISTDLSSIMYLLSERDRHVYRELLTAMAIIIGTCRICLIGSWRGNTMGSNSNSSSRVNTRTSNPGRIGGNLRDSSRDTTGLLFYLWSSSHSSYWLAVFSYCVDPDHSSFHS